jgi:hypothetical protein
MQQYTDHYVADTCGFNFVFVSGFSFLNPKVVFFILMDSKVYCYDNGLQRWKVWLTELSILALIFALDALHGEHE